ncbi:hypothetical protein CsSME_00042700 [Camellia sinensis var. sinensis]
MMTIEKKTRINGAYDHHNDEVVMWADNMNGVVVYFTNVNGLVKQSNICGNVIDMCTELLKTKQLNLFGNDEKADKSYFFSSVCLVSIGCV